MLHVQLPVSNGELAGLVILVEGADLTLSADWKAKAVCWCRWLRHYPGEGDTRNAMAKVLWGDPTVGNSSFNLSPQPSSPARRFPFLLVCACVHILVQARVRFPRCTWFHLGVIQPHSILNDTQKHRGTPECASARLQAVQQAVSALHLTDACGDNADQACC